MRPQSQTLPLLDQFLDQNRVSVKSLRDFKKTARDLIEACRIKTGSNGNTLAAAVET